MLSLKFSKICLFLLIMCIFVEHNEKCVKAISAEEDLTLTLKEKEALDKFKAKMAPVMPHDYMKTEQYLIRWLRAKNLNQDEAEKMLRQNLRWRKENNIDNVEEEDWSYFKDDYPYTADTFDKAGRPIGTIQMGHWDIRRVALAGRMRDYLKYLDKLLEEATQAVIRQQNLGKLVTQWKVIINLEGFNLVQHACPLCLPAYTSFVQSYEDHYPGFADAIILINTPPAFQIILELVRPIFSPPTRKAMKVFGTDKQQWQAYLDKEIDRKQRRPEFGGTLQD